MHDKFMVFDSAAVWTGSMNFTENCAYHNNNNNGIFIDDRNLAANYETKFTWMFENTSPAVRPAMPIRFRIRS